MLPPKEQGGGEEGIAEGGWLSLSTRVLLRSHSCAMLVIQVYLFDLCISIDAKNRLYLSISFLEDTYFRLSIVTNSHLFRPVTSSFPP